MVSDFINTMLMPTNNMKAIFQRYYEKTATQEETDLLMQWMADPANKAVLAEWMREGWEGLAPGEQLIPAARSEAMLESILQPERKPVVHAGRTYRMWPRVAAAAMVLLLLSAGAYLLLHKKTVAVIAAGNNKVLTNDVLPGGNKAVLTLANGSTIVLDRKSVV